jgi:hypothetical protein
MKLEVKRFELLKESKALEEQKIEFDNMMAEVRSKARSESELIRFNVSGQLSLTTSIELLKFDKSQSSVLE